METILGQERAVGILQSALQTGRLHHAYIFHGPRGVGKFTAAREFARILLCHQPQRDLAGNLLACGACESCRLMKPPAPLPVDESKKRKRRKDDDGDADAPKQADPDDVFDREGHPDYHVIRKELIVFSPDSELRKRKQMNIPVSLLRERMIGGEVGGKFFASKAFHSAQLRHGKVFIIDEAELLEEEGQNAMLKTLEEPATDTYIILVTASEDRLLPTIRSRCQRVPFSALPDRIVADWIAKNAASLNEQQVQWLARFVGGSLGKAELALRYELFLWAKAVLPAIGEMQKSRYPADLGRAIADFINGFAERWVDEHPNASKEAANKQAAGLMWAMIMQHARQKLADLSLRCPAGDPVAGEAMLEPWLGAIVAVQEAERALASNVNLSLTCDGLVAALYRALAPPVAAGRP